MTVTEIEKDLKVNNNDQKSEENVEYLEPEKPKFSWRVVDNHSPPEIYNWTLYMSIFVFGILGAARGLDEANSAGIAVQKSFRDQFGLNDPNKSVHEIADLKSNITAMVQLGSIGGAVIASFLVDWVGRVRSMQIVCVCWIVAVIIQITSRTLGQLYVGRLLEGLLAIGLTTTIGPTYISEVTPKAIRGMAGCIFAGAVYLGIMLSYFAHYGTAVHISQDSNTQWIIPNTLKIVFAGLIFILSIFFCVESPRWYIKVGKNETAVKALSKLRHLPETHPFLIGEITDITEQVEFEKRAKEGNTLWGLTLQLVRTKSMRYRFFMLSAMIHVLGQWSGANSVTIYAPELFGLSGIKGVETLKMTAVLGVVKFIGAYISAFFIIDFLGRRKALYIGISLQMMALLFFALFLLLVPEAAHEGEQASDLSPSQLHASKAAMAAIYISGLGWVTGFNSMQYLIGSEIFPINMRSFAQSITMVVHFANQYGNSKALPKMLLTLQPYGTFFFFVGVNFLALTWAWFCIPEVSGRSLESMEELFNLPWYLIGRRGHILCPDHSEVNKIDYSKGKFRYLDKPETEMHENASKASDDKEDD
ncbi:hexose transporter Hxt9p [[Candida] jaroonii]|uniref:Hexose transporter Hxt9p n=1 Tax=[Candida] jaroonii TaxID=467808 RepID=A0ACA9YAX6_9ASCO|nr:hexose transporter Hxt9p [[Candida] jaroonii]